MKITFDQDADALAIVLKSGKVAKDVFITDNIFAGYSKSGDLLEVQILDIEEDDQPYLTVELVSKALNKSERTILRWIEKGSLPAKKVGKEYRIKPKDIEGLQD